MNAIHYNQLNEVMTCKMSINPDNVQIGMMATMYIGSDRRKMIIAGHPTKNSIIVEFYNEKIHGEVNTIDGIDFADVSTYNTREAEAQKHGESVGIPYTWRKNNRWMPKGSGMWGTCSIHIGKGDEYRDPDF